MHTLFLFFMHVYAYNTPKTLNQITNILSLKNNNFSTLKGSSSLSKNMSDLSINVCSKLGVVAHAQAVLKLSRYLRMTLNFWFFCLIFLNAGIIGMYH